MAEPTDWKAKHLNSLREMEAEERSWRALEQVLRRLVNRLCAAAMGIDARLDTQLSKLAEANRRSADVTELGARHDSLSDALKALDASTGGGRAQDFTATITVARAVASSAPPPAARAGQPARTASAARGAADPQRDPGSRRQAARTPGGACAHRRARPRRRDATRGG